MKYYINIEADTNDGDYIQKLTEIDQETLELIKPVIQAINDFEPYTVEYKPNRNWTHDNNYPKGEYRRDDMGEKSAYGLYGHLEGFDTFDELVPYGENGVHSITEIVLLEVNNVEKLF